MGREKVSWLAKLQASYSYLTGKRFKNTIMMTCDCCGSFNFKRTDEQKWQSQEGVFSYTAEYECNCCGAIGKEVQSWWDKKLIK